MQLWDLTSGRKIREPGKTDGNGHALGFAPDGKTLAFEGDGGGEVWSIEGLRLRAFPNESWLGFSRQSELVTSAFETVRLRSSAGVLERETRIPNPFSRHRFPLAQSSP